MNTHNFIDIHTPESSKPLQEVLKRGVQTLLRHTVERELESSLAEHYALKTEDGCKAVLRNGYLSARFIQTGLGTFQLKYLI